MNKKEYYQRQWMLGDFGLEKLEVLNGTRVLIVGMGGLGCPVATYLTSSGIEQLGLVDADTVDVSNLGRQILYSQDDVGKLKVDIAKKRLMERNPFSKIMTYSNKISLLNVTEIISEYDIIVDCTDNFTAKFILHDFCYRLKKKLVIGSVYQWNGWIKLFTFEDSNKPCFRCLWKDVINDSLIQNCSEVGILPSTCMHIASHMVNETLKLAMGEVHLEDGQELLVDMKHSSIQKISWKKNTHCPLCGKDANTPLTYHSISTLEKQHKDFQNEDLSHWILVDIRSSSDISMNDLQGILYLGNMKKLNIIKDNIEAELLPHMKTNTSVLLMCYTGKGSLKLATELSQKQWKNVYSLKGGIKQYAEFS